MIQTAAHARLHSSTPGYSHDYRQALRDLFAAGEGKSVVWLGEQIEALRTAGERQATVAAYADVFWDLHGGK